MEYALVFPGQGSQFVGMGKELSSWSEKARETFAEADDALGFKISRICFDGPEEELRLTENTQPAILTVSIAALRALASEMALSPMCVAGHSLGEYTALVAADSIDFADAVRAVRERGRAMQEAVPAGEGAMAALLGMDRESVSGICSAVSTDSMLVAAANFNAPGQIVIAGHKAGVLAAIELFKERGGKKAVQLPVSAPFHCALMEPAAVRMEGVLGDIRIDSPKTVLINNAEAEAVQEAALIAPSLVRQITSPVLWEDSVKAMTSRGVELFIEIGPGNVLTGLIKRIDRQPAAVSFGAPEDLGLVKQCLEGG
jgi:[acyl-carrier-protein] S-malonyltransferase